jgi:MPBQ/MSBQ methyltransferase
MSRESIRDRVAAQFSYQDERADIWRGFDLIFDTESYLNLGYSPWYLPHFVGSSQTRLAAHVGEQLTTELGVTAGVPLLDVGCGRGGPGLHLAREFGFDITGLDLVPYNVGQATANAKEHGIDATFVVGDATEIPFVSGSFPACTAIDSLVYVPERWAVINEIAGILEPHGAFICSDLVLDPAGHAKAQERVSRFADAWDMPDLPTLPAYRETFRESSLELQRVEDITSHSVGRFQKWSSLYLALFRTPLRLLGNRFLDWYGLDPAAIRHQIRRAHVALPFLKHVVFVARR